MTVVANSRLLQHHLIAFTFRFRPTFPSLLALPSQVGFPLHIFKRIGASTFTSKQSKCNSLKRISVIPRGSSNGDKIESANQNKTPFGFTRRDVLLIGLGVTGVGIGLKSGLELLNLSTSSKLFYGVNALLAGNVLDLVVVLGLTVGWISTYMFRVSNKEMTYAQQLREYVNEVMEKRLESLTEAELAELLEQVEEAKQRLLLPSSEQVS